jgi:serine/threonine protein kinase
VIHSIEVISATIPESFNLGQLCDFGLSRVLPNGKMELSPAEIGTGGTPAYQAPEVLKRRPAGMKLDLYGFGITSMSPYHHAMCFALLFSVCLSPVDISGVSAWCLLDPLC